MTTQEYYLKLRKNAESLQIDIGPDEFYDFWHTHVDWDGVGNGSEIDRRKHLEILFLVFNRVKSQAAQLGKPSQCWVITDPHDSAQDAVYLHTHNPNGTPFPYDFEGISWGVEMPNFLKEAITSFSSSNREIGSSQFDGTPLYWIREIDKD